MADEFALEHWQSRALIAEQERDSARTVLASLRGYLRAHEEGDPRAHTKLTLLRGYQRVHDQTWWNKEHAMNAVIEALADAPSGSAER